MRLKFLLSVILLIQGIISPAFAQRQPIDGDWNSPKCIEEIWERTKPTEEEKKFDLENDPSLTGNRFSCFSQISPTEINTVLINIKNALQNDDKEKLADLIVYPLNYWVHAEEYDPMFGNLEPREARSKQEFIELYDQIITPDLKRIINCTTVPKMRTNGEGSLFVASGYIHIRKQPDFIKEAIKDYNKYPLRIALIDAFQEKTQDWFTAHCQ